MNSRKTLAQISKETGISISTLFDTLKRLEKNVITRHVSLIDFTKVGYGIKVFYTIQAQQKDDLKQFLLKAPNVNNLFTLSNKHDLCAECIFEDLRDMANFKEELENFQINNLQESFIVEELKKEGFLQENNSGDSQIYRNK